MLRCGSAGVEAVEAETRHAFPRHTHEHFGIGVIQRGAQRSHSGRGLVEAGPGDTITVNPGEVHDGTPIGEAGRAWKILYFAPAVIAEAVRDLSDGRIASREFPHPVLRDPGLAERFRRLFPLMTTGGGTGSMPREEAFLMLLTAVMREDRKDLRRAPAVPDAISRARGRIDDDPAAPVTLGDLARESGLSRFQVLRGFVKATGLTPHAYLVQRRIDVARRLLRHGLPLAEAAAASGFADQSHMTRIFVRTYGVTPRAYADAVR